MSGSIQSRLTLALTTAAVVLSAAIGAMLYHIIGTEMIGNFDRGLHGKGQAVVSLVSLEAGGVLDFEFNEAAMPEYRVGAKADYFQIWFANGKPYARAKSLGSGDLHMLVDAATEKETYFDLPLPSGRLGRAVHIPFVPQSEQPPPRAAEPMLAVIARDRLELDQSLQSLSRSLFGGTVALGVATALTSIWIARRSLRPLRTVAAQASDIDATKLDTRFIERGLPAELVPICVRLNDLLSRLEAAFARERRFTSDVAHELRTPIAELRSITEVALKWPDDVLAFHEALSGSLAIAIQMQTLVNTLLSLVRSSGTQTQVAIQSIPLALFTERIVHGLRTASEIGDVELEIDPTHMIDAEPTLFGSVLTNLLRNASEYGRGNARARCITTARGEQIHLTIENETDNLSADDVPRMFEPFWRKDKSRSNHTHAGLGLSLVRAYCELMGIEVIASMNQTTLQVCLVCAPSRVRESSADSGVNVHVSCPTAIHVEPGGIGIDWFKRESRLLR